MEKGVDSYLCVFVGNIPIGVSADDVENMLSRAGTVVNFTIKTDSLGQSKGFGYCEYRDRESVEHAVSLLNNKEFNGNNLIVAYANDIRNERSIDEMSQSETVNLLNEFKSLVAKDKNKAIGMLRAHPALARALFKIELHFGMVHSLPVIEKAVPRKNITPDVKSEPPNKVPRIQTPTIQQNPTDPRLNSNPAYYQQQQMNYYNVNVNQY